MNHKTISIQKADKNTLTIDEMIHFLMALKNEESLSGDTEMVIEYDGGEVTLNKAEIREEDVLFY
jgi:hypothetical protein